jgi:predicted DNA-binding transcriptional regulator AlpA
MKVQSVANNLAVEPAQALLNERDLAARLQLSVKCIQMWRLKGKGPAFLKLGRGGAVRYRLTDVLTWEENCVQSSTSSQHLQK